MQPKYLMAKKKPKSSSVDRKKVIEIKTKVN